MRSNIFVSIAYEIMVDIFLEKNDFLKKSSVNILGLLNKNIRLEFLWV